MDTPSKKRPKKYVRAGGGELPALLSAREFAAYIRKPYEWVLEACESGRILACDKVGNVWVIAQDTLIRPRYLAGFDNALLDVGLPEEMVLGTYRVDVELPPEYIPHSKATGSAEHKMLYATGLRTVLREKELSVYQVSKDTGIDFKTVQRAYNGTPVRVSTVLRLAYSLGVDVGDILREDI